MPAPHPAFQCIRPDEVAECWEGVPYDLYVKLWRSMRHLPRYTGETPPEPDVLCLAKVWDFFTEAEQFTLNYLADKEDDKYARL